MRNAERLIWGLFAVLVVTLGRSFFGETEPNYSLIITTVCGLIGTVLGVSKFNRHDDDEGDKS